MSDFFANLNPDSLPNVVRELQRRLNALEQRELRVGSLSEISAELGEVGSGRILGSYLDAVGDAGANIVYNGDFATTLAGWDTRASSNVTWSILTGRARAIANFISSPQTYIASLGTILMRVKAGLDYTVSATGTITVAGSTTIQTINANNFKIVWYSKWAGGGSSPTILQTDYIGSWDYGDSSRVISATVTAPDGAYYAVVLQYVSLYIAGASGGTVTMYFDDISMTAINDGYRLYYNPGMDYSDGLWPTQQAMPFGVFRAYNASDVAIATFDRIVNSACILNHYWGAPVANTNDADWYAAEFLLSQGTYTINLYGVMSSTSGIIDWWLDGVPISTGMDFYKSSADYDSLKTITPVAVGYNGVHELRGIVNGKNASASDYRLLLSMITIT